MPSSNESKTHATLLLRVRDLGDQAAWAEFLERYGPKIYGWCRRQRLQEADAADVTQDVLSKLVAVMQRFEYHPGRGSFRAWLKTVTRNAIHDVAAKWDQAVRATGSELGHEQLTQLQAPEAIAELQATLEDEAQQEVLREAEARVRLRVRPHTWEAYQGTAVQQRPSTEIAAALGIPVSEVYVARSRVLKMLRQEVEKLSPPEE